MATATDALDDARTTLAEVMGTAHRCELLVLDDAELAIFDDADQDHVAPLRTLRDLDEQATEEALAAAFERLLERELVGHEPVDDGTELYVAEPLASLLVLRSIAPQVVLLERPDSAGAPFRVLYHHDNLVIDEEVDEQGAHRIQLRRPETVVAALADWLVAGGITSATSDPVTVRPGEESWDQLLAGALLGSVLRVVRTPEGVAEDYFAVRRLDGRTVVTRQSDDADDPEAAVVQDVDRDTLVEALAAFVNTAGPGEAS